MNTPTASASKRLFISYAKEDSKFVDWLSSRLRDWLGSTWEIVNSDQMAVGQAIFDAISKTIRSSDAMIYVSSRFATESDNVQAELAWGLAQGQTRPSYKIIPILRDDAATVPHLLRGFLYLDFREGKDREETFLTLGSHLLQGSDDRPVAAESERLRAEANFIELKSALLQEQYAIMRELEAQKAKALRWTLLITTFGAALGAVTVILAIWLGYDARSLLFLSPVLFAFIGGLVGFIGYNSGAAEANRFRSARIDGLLVKGPIDPWRNYGGP